MSLSYYSGTNENNNLARSIVIITGVGRSGKTLVGNLLGSCQQVEHIDEPWLLMNLPVLADQGAVAESLAVQMFQSFTVELMYDRLLMRHANFRPADLSSIWRQKAPEEILSRLTQLYSRDDVRKYARKNQPTLVLTLTDTLPFHQFFWKAFPQCKVLHVLREGLDVALDTTEKHWWSAEEHLAPVHANPYRMFVKSGEAATQYLPYWVEAGDEERYLSLSEYAKGLHYWSRQMRMAYFSPKGVMPEKVPQIVKLSDVLANPQRSFQELIESLGLSKTRLTDSLLDGITQHAGHEHPVNPSDELERAELRKMRYLYDKLELPTEQIDKLLGQTK